MKIVTWNCGGAFRKKYHLLEDAYRPDVMVVQECENPELSTKEFRTWSGSCLWFGENKNKGIGVFDCTGVGLAPIDWDSGVLQSFLPCRICNDLSLLAVWTKHADSPNFRYVGQLWKYIQIHRAAMERANPLIVLGDLNSNTCWDEWDRWWNHSDVVKELEEIGLLSLYHQHFGELQGSESRPTLYHHRKREKPYHVDYAFASEGLIGTDGWDLQIGEAHEWLEYSDHMPLAFSLAL